VKNIVRAIEGVKNTREPIVWFLEVSFFYIMTKLKALILILNLINALVG